MVVRLDVDSWLGVLVVASAALVLMLTAAASAAGLFAGRRPGRLVNGRASGRPGQMQSFMRERERLLSSLVFCRTACIVTGSVTAEVLVMRHSGASARPAIVVAVIAILVASILEAIPRTIISHNPERWGTVTTPIAEVIRGLFFLPASLVDLPGRALLRLRPFRPGPLEEDDDEEIVRLVELEESEGGIEDDEREMIRAVIELEDTTAREIMVPRMDITAVDCSASLQDVAHVIAERGYSRIPLYDGNIDNVVGVVYAKDVLAEFAQGSGQVQLTSIARPAEFVPETKRVDELLSELRGKRVHIAIVVDEYGGTAGLVTIEDLVEEIVGEIEDEYDHIEPGIERTLDGDAVVDARQSVDILKELFDIEVEDDDFDTVGGLIIHRLGKIPAPNDTVEIEGVRLRVLSVTGRRVRKVQISRLKPQPASPASP